MSDARDDLEAAFATLEANAADETVDEVVEEETDGPEEEAEAAESEAQAESGGSEPDAGEHQAEIEEGTPSEEGERRVDEPETPPEPVKQYAKAPVGWDGDLGEAWETLPSHVQQKIASREKEVMQTLGAATEARRLKDEFDRQIGPYIPEIEKLGATPVQAARELLEIGQRMRTGTQEEKADQIAQLIEQNKVDITLLDQRLTHGLSPEMQIERRVQQQVQQALTPYQQHLQQLEMQRQQEYQQSAENTTREIATFADTHPYFESVRESMADLADLAKMQGHNVTLEELYDRACWADPQIRPKLMAEQSQPADPAKKAAAAASVRSSSPAAPATKKSDSNLTTRQALESAWDEMAGSNRPRV